jgi:hypothetical protein
MMEAKAKIALHQVDEYVWCDAHGEIHTRRVIDEPGRSLCSAEVWRPVFTTDSELGQY